MIAAEIHGYNRMQRGYFMLLPFLIAMLLATLILLSVTRLATERLVRQHHGQKTDFFRAHPIQPGDIVFLGDSLNDGCRWHELFPDLPVKNRGINADTTEGVLRRLPEILEGKPAAIFLMIGTNDLPWYEYHADADILTHYRGILEKCRGMAPATRVYVQSLLPREATYTWRIRRLNDHLRALADEFGMTYIDLFPAFLGEHGGLKREITNDSLHLLAGGYAIWKSHLEPYLAEYRKP